MPRALLDPTQLLWQYEDRKEGFQLLAMLEECKAMPWSAVYDEFCLRNDVPVGKAFIDEIEHYESEVTSKRK